MNHEPQLHAIRVGLHRGWTEFVQSIRSPQDQGFYLFMALRGRRLPVSSRNNAVEGTDLLRPVGGAAEHPRRAGRLRRGHRAGLRAGHGARGRHAAARQGGAPRARRLRHRPAARTTRSACCRMMVVILVPSFLLFDDLMHRGAERLAHRRVGAGPRAARHACRIGIIIGSLVPNVQKVGTWGMLPIMVLAGISGIFYPDPGSCGAGCRSSRSSSRCTGSGSACARRSCRTRPRRSRSAAPGARRRRWWCSRRGRSPACIVTPVVLRRMARRQSGSQVEAARRAGRPVGPVTRRRPQPHRPAPGGAGRHPARARRRPRRPLPDDRLPRAR